MGGGGHQYGRKERERAKGIRGGISTDSDGGLVDAGLEGTVLLAALGSEGHVDRADTDGANAASNERVVALGVVARASDAIAEDTSASPRLSDVEGEEEVNVLANGAGVGLGDERDNVHALTLKREAMREGRRRRRRRRRRLTLQSSMGQASINSQP